MGSVVDDDVVVNGNVRQSLGSLESTSLLQSTTIFLFEQSLLCFSHKLLHGSKRFPLLHFGKFNPHKNTVETLEH